MAMPAFLLLKHTYEAVRRTGTWTNAYNTREKDKDARDAKAFTLFLSFNLNLRDGDIALRCWTYQARNFAPNLVDN